MVWELIDVVINGVRMIVNGVGTDSDVHQRRGK